MSGRHVAPAAGQLPDSVLREAIRHGDLIVLATPVEMASNHGFLTPQFQMGAKETWYDVKLTVDSVLKGKLKHAKRPDLGLLPAMFTPPPSFGKLAPNEIVVQYPAVTSRASDWAAANLDETVVGVHVRTWRDDPRRYRKYHVPSLRRLHRLLESTGNARFLVVSDSDDVAPMLAERYGARRVIGYPRTTPRADSWLTPRGVQEDLIDMLLLARTQRLLASYLSTFSEVAWWLGGTKARVSVF